MPVFSYVFNAAFEFLRQREYENLHKWYYEEMAA